MQLESYIAGLWQSGAGAGAALRDATTGEVIASANADGLRYRARRSSTRARWAGRALRSLTFHERAALLKALAKHLARSQGGVL